MIFTKMGFTTVKDVAPPYLTLQVNLNLAVVGQVLTIALKAQ